MLVHCSPETCLKWKNFWTHDHPPWLEHTDGERIASGERDKLDLGVTSSDFRLLSVLPWSKLRVLPFPDLISFWKRLAPYFLSEPAEPGSSGTVLNQARWREQPPHHQPWLAFWEPFGSSKQDVNDSSLPRRVNATRTPGWFDHKLSFNLYPE